MNGIDRLFLVSIRGFDKKRNRHRHILKLGDKEEGGLSWKLKS
jgi:hypothetical protein